MILEDLFQQLDAYSGRIPLDDLQSTMSALNVCTADLGEAVRFGENGYRRNLVRRTDTYEVLALCWAPGQRSPIHDHAQSTCGVRVIAGEATETRYEHDRDGYLHPVSVDRFHTGFALGSEDADIHEIANTADDNLITLHVYSPPLGKMRIYSQEPQARDRSRPAAPPARHPAG